MVSLKSVEAQLKSIHFNSHSWGRAEVSELPNILLDDEKIFECVNGMYEGGFALLVATNIRVLLIDKKPLKYLTVEDVRFDMINQIDYSHRLMGAKINVSAGNKNLRFTSYNQQRLRKLINHLQHRMAEVKTEQSSSAETQQQHLERINEQLQVYLMAQHQHQEELRKQLEQANSSDTPTANLPPVKPAPELADFLYAQSLMQHYEATTGAPIVEATADPTQALATPKPKLDDTAVLEKTNIIAPAAPVLPITAPEATKMWQPIDTESLIDAGRKEVFGARARAAVAKPLQAPLAYLGMEINPLKVAYAKLPALLRQRKYNRVMQRSQAKTKAQASALPNGTQIAGAQGY